MRSGERGSATIHCYDVSSQSRIRGQRWSCILSHSERLTNLKMGEVYVERREGEGSGEAWERVQSMSCCLDMVEICGLGTSAGLWRGWAMGTFIALVPPAAQTSTFDAASLVGYVIWILGKVCGTINDFAFGTNEGPLRSMPLRDLIISHNGFQLCFPGRAIPPISKNTLTHTRYHSSLPCSLKGCASRFVSPTRILCPIGCSSQATMGSDVVYALCLRPSSTSHTKTTLTLLTLKRSPYAAGCCRMDASCGFTCRSGSTDIGMYSDCRSCWSGYGWGGRRRN
ncbi:hypothetical protein CPB85DRAFT_1317693 [Mucidula mucida]|nr:hypothetical protein CPB85DRAFT_1317693 [Mucidula mucida]